MNKFLITISLLIFIVIFISCSEKITGSKVENLPPDTKIFLFLDSTYGISKQKSKLPVYWWGDDPDGFVLGYYIKWENQPWSFTTKTDSIFTLAIAGSDTSYTFYVASVDNSGNGKYDNQVIRNNENYGPEPFTDFNGNGVYDNGEPFVDIGNIDPTPAVFKFPIKNTPPEISFQKNSEVPETTFTAASFAWNASDIDGDETIEKIYIALNDTSSFVEIPGFVRFITIVANPPFSSSTADATIYLGSSLNQPYSIKLPNLRLDNLNRFYLKAKDIAGAFSKTIVMPDTTKIWFVKKPKGEILVIDDYTIADNAERFYLAMFDSIGLGNKVDYLDIKYGKTSTTPGIFLPKFINPTFTATLKLFKSVFWFTDNDPTLEVAQLTLRNYSESGGKVLLSMIFPQTFDTRSLGDFLPIDSVSPVPINFIPVNTPVNLTTDGQLLGYPPLQRDASPSPVARIRTFYPNSAASKSLYTLGLSGNPIIGFRDNEGRRIFIGLPLHRLNGGSSKVKAFFQKVFISEFGVTP
ncbi:MAG: hypothetical protein WHV63_11365 [Ignavibacteria bacterium]